MNQQRRIRQPQPNKMPRIGRPPPLRGMNDHNNARCEFQPRSVPADAHRLDQTTTDAIRISSMMSRHSVNPETPRSLCGHASSVEYERDTSAPVAQLDRAIVFEFKRVRCSQGNSRFFHGFAGVSRAPSSRNLRLFVSVTNSTSAGASGPVRDFPTKESPKRARLEKMVIPALTNY